MHTRKTAVGQVVNKNARERMKWEKVPLDVIHELPGLIERSHEEISEDDLVRLQPHGLYHARPKVGQFMMRIKISDSLLNPGNSESLERAVNDMARDMAKSPPDGTFNCIRLEQTGTTSPSALIGMESRFINQRLACKPNHPSAITTSSRVMG